MIEGKALISGVGISDCGRRLGRDPWSLTAQAALAAIADAGLTPADIDGVSTYPGALASTPGMSGAGADDMRSLLGLNLRWYNGASELPGQLGAIVTAMAAIGAGLANHVLCFRTVWESSAQTQIGSRSETMRSGVQRERSQWIDPIGASHSTYGGLTMQRYMYESGTTREQIGQIAVVARTNAALNPAAVYRDPMSLDDYLASRMISDPLCLYDCDVPMDGSVAFIVSRADLVNDAKRAISIAAIGSAPGFDQSAAMMWSRTDLKPADVDMAQLYDGFSVLTLRWMEALGLCPRNEGGRFIEGGHRIARDGELPLNTNGGQLSGGRMHGFGALHEACVQMRGDAGERQVPKRPQVTAVSSGAEAFTSCLLLTL
ncbi:thiolase family protein [Sphingomonas montanisoli]|uniref:Thiolase family protein n=1 Tax=Sphingomonas montanisoli TaxID=2606412 RepID=A0A5D9C6F6_9SPHN|nr:thiolase family protein [Sphingomonas montanisoli]TZG27384.1 thiolase family protein [Sphingomonas montanisoli]